MGWISGKTAKRALGVLLIIILVGGVAHAVSIDAFNKTEHVSIGADASQATYLKFNDREDSTSTWLKRGFDLDGQKVDLRAQTIDGTLVNDSVDTVASWEAVINIEGDCFINNAWVGTAEIHQYVGTKDEKVQTLDLRNYDLNAVELDYRYDGDLLIPLKKGDFVVYHPLPADEFDVGPKSELTMGTIFYYLDNLDLSNYTVSYYYHRDFTYGVAFIALAALVALWVLLFVFWISADLSYKQAKRELDLRKSSLTSMASIYNIISFIDLHDDMLTTVYAVEGTKEALPEGSGAREKLLEIFARDTAEPYRSEVLEFVDTATLPDRLHKGTIALEYVSKKYGWSEVRFCAADEEERETLGRALFTIQDINDEKREKERLESNMARAALEASTKETFIAGASASMGLLVRAVDDLADKILDEAGGEAVRSYARQIKRRDKLLGFLADGVSDTSRHGASSVQAPAEAYSLAKVIADVCDIAEMLALSKDFAFEPEMSAETPERLLGDARRVERALAGVVAYAVRREGAHSAKLSVYSAVREGVAHLLFSVKVAGSDMSEREARAIREYASGLDEQGMHSVDDGLKELEGVALLLSFAGSKLQAVNDPGVGFELYFELDQEVADDTTASGGDDD